MPVIISTGSMEMHDRPLSAGMKVHLVCDTVEQAEKTRNETIVGEIVAELIVDMHERVAKTRSEA